MNWQALQAVGELTAAVGVIISLLYLAIQVRQNTMSVRAAANQDLLENFRAVVMFGADSPFGARLLHAALRGDWDALSPEEQTAARNTWIATLRLFDQAYLQHEAGLLGLDVWKGWSYQIRLAAGVKGFRDVWPGLKPMLSHSFVAWIEGLGDDVGSVASEYRNTFANAGIDVGTVLDRPGSSTAS